MEFSAQSTPQGALCLTMAGDLVIYQTAEIKQRLIDEVCREAVLELDLSRINEIDTAGLQLLVLAKMEAQRRGHELNIVGHSPAVREVIEFFNMAAYFGDPLVISARDSR